MHIILILQNDKIFKMKNTYLISVTILTMTFLYACNNSQSKSPDVIQNPILDSNSTNSNSLSGTNKDSSTIKNSSNKTLVYSDKTFKYEVTVDSLTNEDNVGSTSSIKSIAITRFSDNKSIQTIVPPTNDFGSLTKEAIFTIEDINFDGLNDFRIIQFLPASPNTPYFFWTYDNKVQQFIRDTTLENISAPIFNQDQKVINSSWRDGCCDHGNSTYKYINGKVTLIEETEIVDNSENPGQEITTTKKLVNGKMKLIKRTVEKSKYQK